MDFRSCLNLAFGICYRSICLPIDSDDYQGVREIAVLCEKEGRKLAKKGHNKTTLLNAYSFLEG